MATLWVVTKTANEGGAGTDADVDIKVFGSQEETPWLTLDNPHYDDFEQDEANFFRFSIGEIGDVLRAELRCRVAGDHPRWRLDRVSVRMGDVSDVILQLITARGILGDFAGRCRQAEKLFSALAGTKVFNVDRWIDPAPANSSQWAMVDLR